MLKVNPEAKVGTFWEYPIEKINEKTPEEIKIIINFKEFLLSKVQNNEWTSEEYDHFSRAVRSFGIRKFIDFVDVAYLLVNLNKQESEKIVSDLGSDHIFFTSINNKSKIHDLAEVVNFIQSKLLSFTKICLTTEEKEIKSYSLEERIEIYESLLAQIQNPESDYLKMLKDVYKSWIEKSFCNQNLREVLLNYEAKIIMKKEYVIKEDIRRGYNILGIRENCQIKNIKGMFFIKA